MAFCQGIQEYSRPHQAHFGGSPSSAHNRAASSPGIQQEQAQSRFLFPVRRRTETKKALDHTQPLSKSLNGTGEQETMAQGGRGEPPFLIPSGFGLQMFMQKRGLCWAGLEDRGSFYPKAGQNMHHGWQPLLSFTSTRTILEVEILKPYRQLHKSVSPSQRLILTLLSRKCSSCQNWRIRLKTPWGLKRVEWIRVQGKSQSSALALRTVALAALFNKQKACAK